MSGTWIETKVEGRLVIEALVPANWPNGWVHYLTVREGASIEQGRKQLEAVEVEVARLEPAWQFRLVHERTETRREDVTE